jgi:hypothetical protein
VALPGALAAADADPRQPLSRLGDVSARDVLLGAFQSVAVLVIGSPGPGRSWH